MKHDGLKNHRILVLGDLMLDRFWWGEVTRISPEAPVPVVKLETTSESLGGAANVAANIAGLGSTPILIGCVGDDSEGEEFLALMSREDLDHRHVVRVAERATTSKTRIVARGQHIVRVDKELADPVDEQTESRLIELATSAIPSVKCVVISDYAKGTLTENILRVVFAAAEENRIPVFVDPKGKEFSRYVGAKLLTPNKREAAEAAGIPVNSQDIVHRSGKSILETLPGSAVLITEGEHGMTLFESGQTPFHVDTVARDVFDVTGAGDTVAAALAISTANGLDLRDAVAFANEAAGLAVEHIGTTKVTLKMLDDVRETLREATQNV